MGVERNDFIFYGWKLPYEMEDSEGNEIDWNSEPYESYEEDEDENGFATVVDGMSGDYVVFGLKIAELDNEDGEGWDFTELDLEKLSKNSEKKCIKEYKKLFKMEPETLPKLLIFSHYH